jgi:branched-chain amino acid transport system permease protein
MARSLNWKKIAVALILLFMAAYPLAHGNSYIMHLFIVFFLWAVVASNWNLLMGYAGIFSLGNIAFFIMGSYISGILAKNLGWSPWLCIFLGGLGSMAAVTIFIGLPSLRLSGIYIALWSLVFASALPSVLTQTQSLTGGARGLTDIPPLFEGITRVQSYYINFVFMLIILIFIYKTIHSSTGLAFVALRDSKEFAKALGVNEYKEKLKIFALVSFITGIAGGFYAHYLGDISPGTLGVGPFLLAIAMIELGGVGRFPGAVLGALGIVFVNESLRLSGPLRLTILGGLICIIVLLFPGGLMQFVDWIDGRINRILKKDGRLQSGKTTSAKNAETETIG